VGWMCIRRWLSTYKFREKSHFIIIISVVISCLRRRVSLSPASSSLLPVDAVCMQIISTRLPLHLLCLSIHDVFLFVFVIVENC